MMAVSCNKEVAPAEVTGEEPEVYEVKIGMGGAITSEITELTKSGESNDIIGIDVWSCPENGDTYSPYAYGIFDSYNDIIVKLLSGYKYKFSARSALDSKDKNIFCNTSIDNKCWGPFAKLKHVDLTTTHVSDSELDNSFHYTGEWLNDNCNYTACDLYYGETSDYTPVEGESVTIDMERVSFGLSISVQNFSEGYVSIKITAIPDIKISYPNTSYYSLYCIRYFAESFRRDDYSEDLDMTAEWTNTDNVTVPLGTAKIKVMRNKLTKVKINAAAPTTDNAFSLQYSEDPLVDSEDDTYEIGGGEVIDTPVE